jgi:hypothetical protein
MNDFTDRIKKHADHVGNVGIHCTTEETTKQALILPLLDILGFSPFDPTKVKAEYGADFPGVKVSERVDYALFCDAVPVMFIEAKAHSEKLDNHCPQLARYFNATPEVTIGAITNGREWRFFTDLANKNMMDDSPFLTVDFESLDSALLERLKQFKHDEFQPEALRILAEETVYLNAFTDVISATLRAPDVDFIRYVASKAGIQRQFNARFIDSVTPIVKQAIQRTISDMVVSGLSSASAPAPSPSEPEPNDDVQPDADKFADIIDPENPKIVTTYAERRLFEVVQDILGQEADVAAKDTERYYSVLFQNKVNRWLLRYQGDKKQPTVTFCIPMTDERKQEVARAGLELGASDSVIILQPEHLARISGILFDCLDYCADDENFKRKTAGA